MILWCGDVLPIYIEKASKYFSCSKYLLARSRNFASTHHIPNSQNSGLLSQSFRVKIIKR